MEFRAFPPCSWWNPAAGFNVIEGWRKKEMESLAAPALASLFRPGDYVPEWKAG
jgi:hypothetical protein